MVGGARQAARSRRTSPSVGRRIERDAYEPAYVQLADILRERIAEGEFHAGDRLPTEAELIHAYGLSPVTVRRAVKILVDEGAVTATPGRGTFVEAASIASASFDLRSFRSILADPAVKVRMLSVRVVPASGRVARMLEIEPGDRVIAIRRLLHRDGRPVMFHRESLTYDPHRPVIETELGVTALRDLFEGNGHVGPKRGRLTLLATTLRPAEAEHLQAAEGEAAFLLEHHFFGFDDRPLSWGVFVCRAELLTFETTVGFQPRQPTADAAEEPA
jgi:DNA-binding GntR family transcriptional regulator